MSKFGAINCNSNAVANSCFRQKRCAKPGCYGGTGCGMHLPFRKYYLAMASGILNPYGAHYRKVCVITYVLAKIFYFCLAYV